MGPAPNLRSVTAARQPVAPVAPAPAAKPEPKTEPAAAPAPETDPGDAILKVLQNLFVTAYGAYYIAQTAHWHVMGPHFNEFHAYFNDEYEYWACKVDVIAEHIRAHKQFLPNSLSELAAKLPKHELLNDPVQLTARYLKYLHAVESYITRLNDYAEAAKWPEHIDLAGEKAREIKKAIWKAEAVVGKNSEAAA